MKLNRFIISAMAFFIIFAGCILSSDPSSGGDTDDPGYSVTGDTASVSSSMGLSAVLLDKNIKNINLKSGDYDGSYLVNSAVAISGEDGVTINDLKINKTGSKISSLSATNVEVTENVGDGDCKIQSCFLTNLTINGGGSNSVEISGNSKVKGNMNVNKKNVSVKMNSTIEIKNALITKACNLIQLDNTEISEPIIDNVNLNIISGDAGSQMNINIVSENINVLGLPEATKMELSGKTSGLNVILNNQADGEIPNIIIADTAIVTDVVSIADTTVDIKITGTVRTISALKTELITINPESVGGKVVEKATAESFSAERLLNFALAKFPKSILGANEFPVNYMDAYDQIVIPANVNSVNYPASFSFMGKDFTISWTSSNESVLSSSGTVKHSQTASFISYISLTAKISYGTASVDKVFRTSVMPLVLTTTSTYAPTTSTTTTSTYVSNSTTTSTTYVSNSTTTTTVAPTTTTSTYVSNPTTTTSTTYVSNSTTSTTVAPTTTTTTIVGSSNVYINLITPTDATIDFGTFNNMLNKTLSESVTITATLDGATSWEWYLNGDFISGEQNNSITITSATLSYGHYTLSVKAYKDSIPYSAFIEFDVHN